MSTGSDQNDNECELQKAIGNVIKEIDDSSSLILLQDDNRPPTKKQCFYQSSDLVNNVQTFQSRPESTQEVILNVSGDSPGL